MTSLVAKEAVGSLLSSCNVRIFYGKQPTFYFYFFFIYFKDGSREQTFYDISFEIEHIPHVLSELFKALRPDTF